MAKKSQKTMQIEGVRYLVYERSGTPWRICVKEDGNHKAYDPVYRAGWQDGGEVEIFTLLPLHSDMFLLQVRIYTKASFNEKKPGVTNPTISVECPIPTFIFIDQEHHRILVQLMCRLTTLPDQRTAQVLVDPRINFPFASDNSART